MVSCAPFARSVQPELAVDGADFGRPDQARMGDRHRMERPFQSFQPEGQKLVEHRKPGAEVVVLPDERLQEGRMIRKPIKNLRRRQTVSFELASKVFGCHSVCPPNPGHEFAWSPPAHTSTKIRNCS